MDQTGLIFDIDSRLDAALESWDGTPLTVEQIARMSGLSKGVVSIIERRALKKFRRLWIQRIVVRE